MHGSHRLTQIADTHTDGAATGHGLRITTHGGPVPINASVQPIALFINNQQAIIR